MNDTRTPRLFIASALNQGAHVALEDAQGHYLRNVMRLKPGNALRCFNGADGEFLARLDQTGKKSQQIILERQTRPQPAPGPAIHLLFAPLKKHRMDQVIEKTVELGVTDLHPVITDRTEVREINADRLRAQIVEAAEQSERLDLPVLHPAQDLKSKIAQWNAGQPIHWGAETLKDGAPKLSQALNASAFLVGPVGGFSETECAWLENAPCIKPVSLGPRVLRAETACIMCLVLANP